ncbi:hypothetical protein [Dysgonomonas reticulitermitis]
MAKQNNTKNNASTDPKTDVVIQPETTPETKNKNETPEIHSDSEQSTVETVGSGQTEGVTDTVLDSKSEAETTGKEGIETGAEIAGGQSPRDQNVNIEVVDDLDEESEFDKLDPAMQKAVAGAALEAINKALKTSDVPSEPKEKTAQRERIATEVFAKNHRKSVLYFTSDMIPFFEKTDAIKHIKGLDDKTIVTVNKE